jgi:sec-independent protein translocase protein TatA
MVGIFESIGPLELIIILAVVLLLFGARRLPEIARSLGRSSKEFKKGMREGATDEEAEEERAQEAKKSD